MAELRCRRLWTGKGMPMENAIVRTEGDRILSIDHCDLKSGFDHEFGMPAFFDAHCHFSWMLLKELSVDLSSARNRSDLLEIVSEAVRIGSDYPVRGESFDESSWENAELPSLEELDEVTCGKPVFLCRVCGHAALANSAMLDLMDEDQRWINRNTGWMKEKPVLEFSRRFPPDPVKIQGAFKATVHRIHKAGVTGICTVEKLENCLDIHLAELPLDVTCAIEGITPGEVAGLPGSSSGMLKLFLDGSFGAGSASVAETGEINLMYDDTELLGIFLQCGKNNVMPVLHAIGSGALKQIDRVSRMAFEELGNGFEVRVEHAEDLADSWPGTWDPRFHVFSMQPNFVENWQRQGGMYDRLIGSEHSKRLNPFRTVLASGFRLGFGSDSMPLDPLYGIRGAVRHRDPGQSLSTAQALAAYTVNAAGISAAGSLSTPLAPGRQADMVFLSGDPFNDLEGTFVTNTMHRGEMVYTERTGN